ncbi:helix-turn-helix domain-containing protein [Alistipes sp.]|uniref:winged helix-turn-helix transcriptional regulator n=1 Tax=Alistipes sp. TaxID=1872444 RepID=UPI000ECE0DEC|nr:helix-turn-helix domain-containing protein [Alistipes sp.]HCN13070.1 transcriptional regulator [Alistipes sp.]
MDRTTLQDSLYPECPIRNILARMGDKWSLLTLYTLAQGGTLRFGALRRAIPDISQKMLAATLRTLTEDGLVVRRLYPEIPPRTEYSLTERARTLLPHLDALIGWAIEHSEAILADRRAARGGD